MKANKKFIEAGDGKGVSAVVGVILMVAITVSIAATVYFYMIGLVSDIGGVANVIPELQFMQRGDSLIVFRYNGDGQWSSITINGNATKPPDNSTIDVGDAIRDCDGQIIITYDGELIAVYEF